MYFVKGICQQFLQWLSAGRRRVSLESWDFVDAVRRYQALDKSVTTWSQTSVAE